MHADHLPLYWSNTRAATVALANLLHDVLCVAQLRRIKAT